MSKETDSKRLVVVAMLSLVVAACSHTATPSSQVQDGFAPFSSTRNQAVGLVSNTKRSLGSEDANTLAAAYTALEEKANAYAGFMVEAITTSSFDLSRNTKYAADLTAAIAAFDRSVAPLSTTHQRALASAWLPTFAVSLQSHWDRYSGVIAQMSPQTKANLIAEIKRDTVWPNYEDIATEPVASR